MKNNIHIKSAPGSHRCTGEMEGDWMVFRCPVCEYYERRVNIKTGEMKSDISPENTTPHHGFEFKPGIDNMNFSPN